MNTRELCKARWRLPNGTSSPLLLPSFSSRGFASVADIHAFVVGWISRASLISAFDLSKRNLPLESAYHSDTVFIDSGGYEVKQLIDPGDVCFDNRDPGVWTFDMYKEVLSNLKPLSDITIVSFDGDGIMTLAEQVRQATDLSNAFPDFPIDFLWKPSDRQQYHTSPRDVVAHIDTIRRFRCFGVTDKELGPSLVHRCRMIAELRCAFEDARCEIPIHVFGCLDPLCSTLYFLCGADVFDGLSWLKYAFVDNTAVYIEQAALLKNAAHLKYEDLLAFVWVNNLKKIELLQNRLSKYAGAFRATDLSLSEDELGLLQGVMSKAEIGIEEAS
jgi:hypothetical protein